MRIVREKIQWKIFAAILSVLNRYDNFNNCDIEKNGERELIDFLFSRQKEKTLFVALDVGANIGSYSEMLFSEAEKKKIMLNLHAFEPSSSAFNILNEKLVPKGAIVNQTALSNRAGTAPLYADVFGSTLSSFYKRKLDVQFNSVQSVEMKRLDQYIEEKNIRHINFLKVDVEGHEKEVLDGMGKYLHNEFVDFIQFEYGGCNLDSHTTLREIYSMFETNGFKVAKLMPGNLQIRPYYPYMENFLYSNFVAYNPKNQ